MGKVLAAIQLRSREKHLQGRALERTYWKSTWSQSEPQFPFLLSKVVWLGFAKILPTLRFKQRLEDAGGQGEEILFVANQMMDYVSLWTKPGTENSPSSFQSWGWVGCLLCCLFIWRLFHRTPSDTPWGTVSLKDPTHCRERPGKMGWAAGSQCVCARPATRWKQEKQLTICLASNRRIKGCNFASFIWSSWIMRYRISLMSNAFQTSGKALLPLPNYPASEMP